MSELIRNSLMSNAVNRDNNDKQLLQQFKTTKEVENYEIVDEKIYYNLKLYNDTTDDIPVRFNINRVNSIIGNNPQEYELGVENFSVPTFRIPIFRQEPNNDDYKVTVEDTDTDNGASAFVDFHDMAGIQPTDSNIYNYETLRLAINKAIAQACNALGLTEYPFILYSGGSNFEFYFPPMFTTSRQDPLNPIYRQYRLYFNYNLYRFFSCFQANDGGAIDSTISQGENLVTWNGIDYAVRKSQWDPRPSMIRWTRILFLTDTIPVKDELLGSENQKMEPQILDYIINNRVLDVTNINYFPQYIKWNNLINSSDLRRVTIRIMLEYEDGTLYPLLLSSDQNFFMKLVFRRKNNGLSIK